VNIFDIIVTLALGFGFFKGFKKGFVVEIASLGALFLGILGAVKFSSFVAQQIKGFFDWNPMAIKIISYLLVFILIVYGVSVLAKGLTRILSQASLGLFNKFLGSVFGVLKWAVLTSFALFFIIKINQWITIIDQEMINQSILYGPITELGEYLFNWGNKFTEELPNDLI
jgi:membrane protein required for colicin V production